MKLDTKKKIATISIYIGLLEMLVGGISLYDNDSIPFSGSQTYQVTTTKLEKKNESISEKNNYSYQTLYEYNPDIELSVKNDKSKYILLNSEDNIEICRTLFEMQNIEKLKEKSINKIKNENNDKTMLEYSEINLEKKGKIIRTKKDKFISVIFLLINADLIYNILNYQISSMNEELEEKHHQKRK